MKKSFLEGGHWEKKGYYYRLFLNLPDIEFYKTVNMYNREHKVKKVSFPTYFLLTENSMYVNIELVILGFGLSLEIQTKGY